MHAVSDAFRTTLRAARNTAENRPVNAQEIEAIVKYLESPGSGPNRSTSFSEFLESKLVENPAMLERGQSYVAFSGEDSNGISNFDHAREYVKHSSNSAGTIGDTPWGKYVDGAKHDPEVQQVARKLSQHLKSIGLEPRLGNSIGAVTDMMWNGGSPEFARNAVLSGHPVRGFLENAPDGRGFASHELPVLLRSPEAILNGRHMRDFGPDPLSTARQDSANINRIERDLAGAASFHTGTNITLGEFRSKIDLRYGFDAAQQTTFAYPPDQFERQPFDQMIATADRQSRIHAQRIADPIHRTPVELAQQMALDGAHGRGITALQSGPLSLTTEAAGTTGAAGESGAAAATSAQARPSLAVEGRSPHVATMGSRAFAVAGEVGLAGDALYTLKRTNDLTATGNTIGTQSEVIHFGSRNLSAWGGAVLGAEAGAALGIESGPGAFVTATVGGIAGTVGGDKIAAAVDDYRTYHQADRDGHTWHMDPEKPEQGWTRQISGGPAQGIGHGPHAMPTQTLTAGPELASELNYKASGVQVQLQLANPSIPHDPYMQKSDASDTPSLREANWRRDPETHQWNRQVTDGYLEHGLPRSHQEQASPERASLLDQAAQATIAENKSIQPHAIAGRYLEAHHQFGWDRFGPPEPSAVHAANAPRNVQQASDGNEYIRGRDGQWTHEGMFGGQSQARGNLRDELEASAPAQAPHQHGLKQGFDPSLMQGETLHPAAQKSSEPRSELGDRLNRMLEAANQGDWNGFRQDTQDFANMQPGQQLQAFAVTMADGAEALNAEIAMRQAQQQAPPEHQAQQQQQQQQAPVHSMSR